VYTGTALLTSNIRLSDRKPVHKHIIQTYQWPTGSVVL